MDPLPKTVKAWPGFVWFFWGARRGIALRCAIRGAPAPGSSRKSQLIAKPQRAVPDSRRPHLDRIDSQVRIPSADHLSGGGGASAFRGFEFESGHDRGSIRNGKTRETGAPGGSGSSGSVSAISRARAAHSVRSRPVRRFRIHGDRLESDSPPFLGVGGDAVRSRRSGPSAPAAASLIRARRMSAVGPRRPLACQRDSHSSWASQ